MPLSYLGLNPTFPDWWAGPINKPLLLMGCGRCLWEDVEKLRIDDFDVMCIKDSAMHYPGRVDHIFSSHTDQLYSYIQLRKKRRRYNTEGRMRLHTHGTGDPKYPKVHGWRLPGHGTSGLNALYAAILMGYPKIILAGMPLDNSGHYYDPPGRAGNIFEQTPDRDGAPRYWHNLTHLRGRVFSLSGRTKALFGEP